MFIGKVILNLAGIFMWKYFTFFVFNMFLVLTLCCGCSGLKTSSPDKTMVNGKPYWYWQPSAGGVIGGVGEAGHNINGANAQRQLAITRAIESIAQQKGVKVSQVQEIEQHASQTSSSVNINAYSIHTVDGAVVTAAVREVWQNPENGSIVVWATEVK